jgi:hypothetical protein
MWDAEHFNIYSSKFTNGFRVVVLGTLRVLNVNCVKILAKKSDFMACVTCMERDLSIDVTQHRA